MVSVTVSVSFTGVKHGKGTLQMRDGGYYKGDFNNGEITGRGERSWSSGNFYTGLLKYYTTLHWFVEILYDLNCPKLHELLQEKYYQQLKLPITLFGNLQLNLLIRSSF